MVEPQTKRRARPTEWLRPVAVNFNTVSRARVQSRNFSWPAIRYEGRLVCGWLA